MGTQAWKRFGVFARCRTWESFPLFPFRSLPVILLMEEILHQLRVGSLSHYLQSFIHPRWLFGISSINSAFWVGFWGPNNSENVMCFGSPGIDWRTNWKKKTEFLHRNPRVPLQRALVCFSEICGGLWHARGFRGELPEKHMCNLTHDMKANRVAPRLISLRLETNKTLKWEKNLSVKPSKILITPSPPETMLIKCSTIRDHPSKTWVPKPRSASTWGTPKKYGSNPKQIFWKITTLDWHFFHNMPSNQADDAALQAACWLNLSFNWFLLSMYMYICLICAFVFLNILYPQQYHTLKIKKICCSK